MSIYPLKSGWKVLDIGANVGSWTREAVRLGCTVVSCEPIAKYRQSILDAGAAIVLPVAVSDIADQITLNVGADDRFSSVHAAWVKEADSVFGWYQDVRQYTVDTMRLDRIIAVYGEFDFIKCDVEGAEPSVIVNNGIVLSVYSFMEVAAFTTQDAVVAIADTSSMAVNARLKWEDENDTAETWNPISDNSEAWTPISDQSETWNAISDSSETWTAIADNSETWQIAA